MTLLQLSYFLAAARHGSFSAAADALHLAQPSLSEQVRRLEDELGVALFARAGRGLVLTEAGVALEPHAERVIAAAEGARDALRDVRTLRRGTVSFGVFGNAPSYLLADLVSDFRGRHPEVALRLVGQNSSEVADAVRGGELEAALVALPIDDRGVDLRLAIRDEFLFVSADAARTRRRMTIERLATVPLVLYDARFGWSDPTRRQLAERAQRAGVSLEPPIEVEELEAAVQIAARGLGDTVAPQSEVLGVRFPKRLHSVAFDPPLENNFAFITRRGAHLSPGSREILAVAEKRIGALGRRMAA